MEYTVEITKKYMKTVTISVPDHVTEEDAREFANEAIDDLFDLEYYQGPQEWDEEDFFDIPTTLTVNCSSDDDFEFELDGFSKKDA